MNPRLHTQDIRAILKVVVYCLLALSVKSSGLQRHSNFV